MRAPPKRPQERVMVAELGTVTVVGLLLSQRLSLFDDEQEQGDFAIKLLAACVVDDTGAPIYDRDGWDAYGGIHATDAVKLIDAATRVSGLNSDANKKK